MTDTEWLEWRRGGAGASDLAAADTGMYGGLYGRVADKLGIRHDNEIAQEDADRGHRWEQAIADGVHALTGYYVHGEQLWVTSADNPRWLSTIDGLLDPRDRIAGIDDADAVLEVKTSRQHAKQPWDYYRAQVQWQMLVCGKRRALIAVAVIGVDDRGDECVKKLILEWVERDDYHIKRLVDLAVVLLGYVDRGELPEPDESTRLADVRAVNAEADETQTADIEDLDEDCSDLLYLKRLIKEYRAEVDRIEATIRHRMGEATEATTSDGRWRVRVGVPVQKFTGDSEAAALLLHPEYGITKLDRQRFKAEHPGLYDDLKAPSTDRRLTVKEMEGNQ